MLAGLAVWLIGTPYFFLMHRHPSYCADPAYRSMTWLVVCAVAGPLLVAAGLGLTGRRRSGPAWLVLGLATLVGLCAIGLVALEQAGGAAGVSRSLVRCDG